MFGFLKNTFEEAQTPPKTRRFRLPIFWSALSGHFQQTPEDQNLKFPVSDFRFHYLDGVPPHATTQEDRVKTALILLPKHIRQLCIQSGLEIWLTPTPEDARYIINPSKAHTIPDDHSGLHIPAEITRSGNPAIAIPVGMRNPDAVLMQDTGHVVLHEIGHHVSALMLGVHQCHEFAQAFAEDYKELHMRIRRHKHKQDEVSQLFGHYLPAPYGDNDSWQAALSETFSEIFALTLTDRKSERTGYHARMPRCYMFMMKFRAELEHNLELMMKGEFVQDLSWKKKLEGPSQEEPQ